MAALADLRKIGSEGFALIDKYYGPPRKSSAMNEAFPKRQGRCVVLVPNDEMEEPSIINSRDAASRYGGVMLLNCTTSTKGKPQSRWGKPFKA